MRTIFFPFMLLMASTSTVLADSISCGQSMIQGGLTDPVTKDEVLQKCGEPSAKEGNDWIYERDGGATAVLHLNDNGDLESISERVGD